MHAIDIQSYHPMDPACQQDPFPYYAALRREAPVFRHPTLGMFFVSRLETVVRVLQDHRTFSSRWGNTAGPPPVKGTEQEVAEIIEIAAKGYPAINTMLTADPPSQIRYRKSIGRAFTTKRILSTEPHIRAITDDLIDRWPERGRVDVMRQLTVPLPVLTIAGALCIPEERAEDVKRWSDDAVAGIGVSITVDRAREVTRSIVEMQHYLASLIDERRNAPRDDFLSELLDADFEDEDGTVRKLEVPEMLSMIQQLMVAGNEATTKGMNELIKQLIQNPMEWKRIQEDPACIPAVVEEGLRLASPNQGLFRIVKEDIELEGVSIPKGSMVWVMFGSANRDERTFADPDRFDSTRDNLTEHVAFGRGAHFCIGAALARLELRVLLEQLAARIERMDFAPGMSFEYEPSFILRGLKSLEIEMERRG
jgi:cytochrome P450